MSVQKSDLNVYSVTVQPNTVRV